LLQFIQVEDPELDPPVVAATLSGVIGGLRTLLTVPDRLEILLSKVPEILEQIGLYRLSPFL